MESKIQVPLPTADSEPLSIATLKHPSPPILPLAKLAMDASHTSEFTPRPALLVSQDILDDELQDGRATGSSFAVPTISQSRFFPRPMENMPPAPIDPILTSGLDPIAFLGTSNVQMPSYPPGFSMGPNSFIQNQNPLSSADGNINTNNGNIQPSISEGNWHPTGPPYWPPVHSPPGFFQDPSVQQYTNPITNPPPLPMAVEPFPQLQSHPTPPYSAPPAQREPWNDPKYNANNGTCKLFTLSSTGPRGTTSIEALEEKAGSAKEPQKVLTFTRPGQSWVTELPDWRTKCDDVQRQQQRPVVKAGQEQVNMTSMASRSQSAMPFPAKYSGGGAVVPPPGFENKLSQLSNTTVPIDSISNVRRPHKVFRPMTAVLYPSGAKRELSEDEKALRQRHGISENYQGNPDNPKNQSADIPNEENCALFLTNLPARCNYPELLGAIRLLRPGRIWSTYINRPLGSGDEKNLASQGQQPAQLQGHFQGHGQAFANKPLSHRTSAAKVIFYHPSEAQRLMHIAEHGGFKVGGRTIIVKWNRHRTAAQKYDNPTSRVVIISGPMRLVEQEWLSRLFDQYFEYHTEEVLTVAETDGWRALEWRFASMRAQAHSAHQLLRSLYPGIISVQWALDPCAGYLQLESEVKQMGLGLGSAGGQAQPQSHSQSERASTEKLCPSDATVAAMADDSEQEVKAEAPHETQG